MLSNSRQMGTRCVYLATASFFDYMKFSDYNISYSMLEWRERYPDKF